MAHWFLPLVGQQVKVVEYRPPSPKPMVRPAYFRYVPSQAGSRSYSRVCSTFLKAFVLLWPALSFNFAVDQYNPMTARLGMSRASELKPGSTRVRPFSLHRGSTGWSRDTPGCLLLLLFMVDSNSCWYAGYGASRAVTSGVLFWIDVLNWGPRRMIKDLKSWLVELEFPTSAFILVLYRSCHLFYINGSWDQLFLHKIEPVLLSHCTCVSVYFVHVYSET